VCSPRLIKFMRFLALVSFFLSAALFAKAPNLVIILTDDQGYNDVGFNGCEDIPTPNIDSIAAQGKRFTDAYVTYPVCGPSRAGLLTGRYQDRFGFTTNPTMDPANPIAGIPHDEENIAEVMRKVGYKSAIIGKWHMGSHPSNHPLERGFDHFFGFLAGGHQYFPEALTLNDLSEVTEIWEWYDTRIMVDHERIDIDDYLTDELTDAANAFINEQAGGDNPFLVYLAYNAPHEPMQATEKYLSRFPDIADPRRRTYAAMVSAVDDGVGRVLETLRCNGIEEETIVVFLSDNGGSKKNASNNGPLTGFKGSLMEGGVRVPFAMQWKGVIPAGGDFTHPIISLDIMATLVGLSGVEIAPERPLDGVNLIPYLTGEVSGAPHAQLFWRKWERNGISTRAGDVKLVSEGKRQTNNYKMFNLADDIGESNNLIKQSPDQLKKLLAEIEAWNSQLKDRPFPSLGEDKWWER